MLKVHELVLVFDPVEALKDEVGFFQVTSPTGQTRKIRLERGYLRIQSDSYHPEKMRTDQLWQIIKLGELKPNDTHIENEGTPERQTQ